MGIRETLNRSPGITAGAVGGVIVLALIWIIMSSMGGGPSSGGGVQKFWYTVDDGATYFADSIDKTPPFEHDGKQAVLCHVYTCNNGKTKFVVCLERYTPQAKKRRDDMIARKTLVGMEDVGIAGLEVKPPLTGDKGWVDKSSQRGTAISTPKCKDGKAEDLMEVWPE